MLQEDDNLDFQVLDPSFPFSLSLSLASEPPDIRNWYSSYKYESPASDSVIDLGCSSLTESQCEKEELHTEESNRVKDEILGEFRSSELGFVKCKRDNTKLENARVNERNHDCKGNDSGSRKTGEEWWAESRSKSIDTEPTEDVKTSSRKTEDSLQELEENKRIDKNGKRSLVVNGDSKEATSIVRNDEDKENGGKETAENDFISTRRKGCRGENDRKYSNKLRGFHSECSRKRERRVPLSEKTNVQRPDVTEIAGKWRCPQKGKPDIGPPLKQLRLERWVHRL